MSYLLACSLGHRITAIASVTGTMTPPMQAACTPSHPTPVMEIHGTADAVVPYIGNVSNVAVDSVIKYWIGINHCNPIANFTAVPDIAVGDGCTAEHYVYSGGDNGSTVELFKIIGGGHTWPGAPFVVGVTNMDFSASAEIWRFFSQYSLNNLATNTEDIYQNEKNHFLLFPNPSKKDFALSFTNSNRKEISIFDYLGKRIYLELSTEKLLRIELNKKGIYFLQVKEAETLTTQKIVIE
jgi:polyhydroxybutyrate depolymerase